MMCRTVILIIEFKLLNRMEKILRFYPLIHYGDFRIDKSKKSICRNFRYIDTSLAGNVTPLELAAMPEV